MSAVGSDPSLLPPPPESWPPRVDAATRRANTLNEASVVLVGLGAGLVALRALGVSGPPCPFRAVTGMPCPGCGITRLAATTAQGDVLTAIGADPAGLALLAILAVLAVTRIVRLIRHQPGPAPWTRSRALPAALIVLGAVHWGTTIVTGGLTT